MNFLGMEQRKEQHKYFLAGSVERKEYGETYSKTYN